MDLLITFGAALVATLIGSMSGAGTAAILVPALLTQGFSYPLVAATSLITSAFWTPVAAFNYLRGKKIDWSFILTFSLVGLIGSYIGINTIIYIDHHILSFVVGVIVLILVAGSIVDKDFGLLHRSTYWKKRQWIAYPFAFPMGFYETGFAPGNGIIFTTLALYTKGYDFMTALGHYYVMACIWCIFGAALLVGKGYFDIPLMSVAILGSVIGAYTGSRFASLKGNFFIKIMFVIIGGLLGMKLVLGI
jgi:hypothetical protein